MDIRMMDSVLRELTPHEKLYREGKGFYAFDNLPVIKKNGQSVKVMTFSMNTENFIPSGDMLFLKKQSRFQPCPMHIHDWIEINYMYSGCCPQVINTSQQTLQKGQIILIDTDTPHSTAALQENDIMISLVINKQYLTSNFFNRFSEDSILSSFFINAINKDTNHDNYILFHSEHSRKLPLFFNELICEIYSPSINSADIVNSLVTLILCELLNVYEKDIERQNLDMNRNSISPILRYIERNYTTCTLESTAAFFNMNPSYMTTLLKKRTGFSYKELVQTQRLTRAAQLLRNTEASITEIANVIGYENMSFFYRKFQQKFGCSPKEYRLKKQPGASA